ncbi:MAG TPA: DUF3365 domain-containing protein [Kiritimatiellia bacterium]|nr:DUF3365 domain-containing protein [Kiritimatiellia bacterium]HMO98284.1 DUF3365 domain-containing protein [Kiritimatiellia bacterium]HMP96281.1 DUF3365 domain-containing protein [Kiritimatiellia bacterium]
MSLMRLSAMFCVGMACHFAAADTADPFNQSRLAANELGAALKSRLIAAVQEGGMIGAIAVCQEEAPRLAREISESRGVTVRRVSDRTRNPVNRPSDREAIGLARLEAQLGEGADPSTLEWAEVGEAGHGETELRFLKPIIVDALCLACHGRDIDPSLQAVLAERYPGDLATGYELGQLRGAFSVTIRSLADAAP